MRRLDIELAAHERKMKTRRTIETGYFQFVVSQRNRRTDNQSCGSLLSFALVASSCRMIKCTEGEIRRKLETFHMPTDRD